VGTTTLQRTGCNCNTQQQLPHTATHWEPPPPPPHPPPSHPSIGTHLLSRSHSLYHPLSLSLSLSPSFVSSLVLAVSLLLKLNSRTPVRAGRLRFHRRNNQFFPRFRKNGLSLSRACSLSLACAEKSHSKLKYQHTGMHLLPANVYMYLFTYTHTHMYIYTCVNVWTCMNIHITELLRIPA